MNEFEVALMILSDEASAIQKEEMELQAKSGLFNQKLIGFLKEHGLPENFTLPQIAMLAIRKARRHD